jgi:hypothetical protein
VDVFCFCCCSCRCLCGGDSFCDSFYDSDSFCDSDSFRDGSSDRKRQLCQRHFRPHRPAQHRSAPRPLQQASNLPNLGQRARLGCSRHGGLSPTARPLASLARFEALPTVEPRIARRLLCFARSVEISRRAQRSVHPTVSGARGMSERCVERIGWGGLWLARGCAGRSKISLASVSFAGAVAVVVTDTETITKIATEPIVATETITKTATETVEAVKTLTEILSETKTPEKYNYFRQ